MPQNGFHGLIGLATAKALARRVPIQAAQPLVLGTVLGSMLPDIDMYPTGVAFLLKRPDLTYVIHRTATHSLLFALSILLVAAIIPRSRWLCVGLSVGICTHIVLDTFFWFTQIDMFWPFSRTGTGLPIVNLWSHEKLTGLWANFREAFEYAAFAAFLGALRSISVRFGYSGPSTVKWERALWACFAIAMVTTFIFRDSPANQNYIVSTPYLLVFFPYCLLQVMRRQAAITQWAVSAQTEAAV